MLSIIRENDSASFAERNGKDPGRYESYRRLYDLGLNLVPKCSRDPKAAAKPWKQWQTERLPLDVFLDYLNYARQNNVNMAIVTGAMPWHDFGIVVVDPDDAEALKVVQKRCPDTAAKSITGRGQHWVYRHPRKGPIHNATGIEIDGVDYDICIKGDGGMCTAPARCTPTAVFTRRSPPGRCTCLAWPRCGMTCGCQGRPGKTKIGTSSRMPSMKNTSAGRT